MMQEDNRICPVHQVPYFTVQASTPLESFVSKCYDYNMIQAYIQKSNWRSHISYTDKYDLLDSWPQNLPHNPLRPLQLKT